LKTKKNLPKECDLNNCDLTFQDKYPDFPFHISLFALGFSTASLIIVIVVLVIKLSQ